MRLAGIDGCPTGWVAVVAEAGQLASARMVHLSSIRSILDEVDFAVVDMPIGLVDGPNPRDVEQAMRGMLKGKASSVFPTPARRALSEFVYDDASYVNRETLGRGLTKQTFMLFPKIREVDAVVREVGQSRIREGHPEVSFAEMAGRPVLSKKRSPQGQQERIGLLSREAIHAAELLAKVDKGRMGIDDVLDAAALLWSAARFAERKHITLPSVPSRDSAGLEMSVIA